MKKSRTILYITLILILGFGLRIFNIGFYSLWNDEAGQLLAALQPTISGMIDIMKTHAMAMPLDYLITRLISRITLSESILRLPSAMWGSLSILFFFLFTKELLSPYTDGTRISLFASFIFTLSPIHIYYSQEMRFYAALGAFFWLVNLLILIYLKSPSKNKWLALVMISILGIYFHPYVLITYLNGFILLIFSKRLGIQINIINKSRFHNKNMIMIATASIIAMTAFLAWLILIEPSSKYSYDVLQYSESLLSFFLKGVGWKSISFCPNIPSFGLWEIFLIASFMVGIILIYIQKTINWKISVIILCFLAQIASIVFINWFRGYWVIYRQIIHLAPFLMIPISVTINETINITQKFVRKQKLYQVMQYVCRVCIIILIMVFAYPRIRDYYQNGKSNAEEIVKVINAENINNGMLLVIPGYETKIYDVYFEHYHQIKGMTLAPTTLENLSPNKKSSEVTYLVIPMKNLNHNDIISHGYEPVLIPENTCLGLRALYKKTNNQLRTNN